MLRCCLVLCSATVSAFVVNTLPRSTACSSVKMMYDPGLMQDVYIYDSEREAEVDDLRQEAAAAQEEAAAAQAESCRLQAELDELLYASSQRDALQEDMIAGLQAELVSMQEELRDTQEAMGMCGSEDAEATLDAQQEEITRLSATSFFLEEELRDTQRAWREQADCHSVIAEQMVTLKAEFDGAMQALDVQHARVIDAECMDAEYMDAEYMA